MAANIALELTERQAEYLKDIMDFWMDDVQATNDTIHQDTMIDSIEMLTVCADGIQSQYKEIVLLRNTLWEAMKNDSNGNRSSNSSTL